MTLRARRMLGLALVALLAAGAGRPTAPHAEVPSGQEPAGHPALREGCADTVAPQVQVDSGHPWRPPFGVDRVGRPLTVRVAFTAAPPPRRDYYLAGYRGGRATERHRLRMRGDTSPVAEAVEFTSFPEEVALWVRCRPGGPLEELTRQPVSWPALEAEAVARPNRQLNPVDLGTILVPHDWLLLAGGRTAVLEVAAIAHARDLPHARLRAWFEGGKPVEIAMPLAVNRRAVKDLKLPLTSSSDRSVLHVSLTDGNRELWKKAIRTMIVAQPPRWPAFGAVATKLRYDAPIPVKDPQTGAFSSIDYPTAWDPQLQDVVVFLPNGSRFVFWRGSSYVPFWAGRYNTGACYQWAENLSQAIRHRDGTVDYPEPLYDRELRYGRVRILESTPSRVHVRWTYQSTDLAYRVWGDQASEDFYFYPDGFGTRVLTLSSPPGTPYQLTEFIVVTPQAAFPLDVLPRRLVDVLFLDGEKRSVTFPVPRPKALPPGRFSELAANPRQVPVVYRLFAHKDDPAAAIYFSPRDPTVPGAYGPFYDRGQLVTPTFWGSQWPLVRGTWISYAINERISSHPAHNSVAGFPWAPMPQPLATSAFPMPDALGRSQPMTLQRWVALIAQTDAPDEVLLDWAHSFSDPPSLHLTGARIDFPSYSPERRALRLVVESPAIEITLKPVVRTVNPVFELAQAPQDLASVTIDGQPLPAAAYAWDGATLWIKATIGASGATIGLRFR